MEVVRSPAPPCKGERSDESLHQGHTTRHALAVARRRASAAARGARESQRHGTNRTRTSPPFGSFLPQPEPRLNEAHLTRGPAWRRSPKRSPTASPAAGRTRAAAMGKLARLLDGIKGKLAGSGGGGGEKKKAVCSGGGGGGGDYGKLDKTGSMRVEIRSRRAQKLIAKNLAAADSITGRSSGGGRKKEGKKRFFAF
ncbi:hypothetical protein ACP70R_006763 [Stipagrostis hirtigluma subsp. patula]